MSISPQQQQPSLDVGNINDLLSQLKEKLTCDSNCQKMRTSDELKKKWTTLEKNAKNSTNDIEEAKKNYFLYTGGESGYKNQKKSENVQFTSDYENKQNEEHNKITDDIDEMLNAYSSNTELTIRLNELLELKKNENNELEKKIDEYGKIAFTSERKVIYEGHDMKRIMIYNKICVFLYYAFFVLYLVIGNFFADKLYDSWKVWVIVLIYLIFPFTLHWFVKKIFDIKNEVLYFFNNKVYKNVYTNI